MTQSFVLAYVDGRSLAFAAADIESVIDIGVVTTVPRAPPHIIGLCAVRSQILTVVDIARAAGLAGASVPSRALVTVVGEQRYALLVDEVDGVVPCNSDVEHIDDSIGPLWRTVCSGKININGRYALALDVSRLVSMSEPLAT